MEKIKGVIVNHAVAAWTKDGIRIDIVREDNEDINTFMERLYQFNLDYFNNGNGALKRPVMYINQLQVIIIDESNEDEIVFVNIPNKLIKNNTGMEEDFKIGSAVEFVKKETKSGAYYYELVK
jgi:hypothetical protein